ncbi:hypothetical protein C0557_20595 [Kosakonia sp. MUSA4]|nr:hypothetical protein C0557_20595 [Kosakonia sp. MUSA4]
MSKSEWFVLAGYLHYPVDGWWKYLAAQDRYANRVRYSLLVSIDVPDENIDIYNEVENIVNIENQIDIEI